MKYKFKKVWENLGFKFFEKIEVFFFNEYIFFINIMKIRGFSG